MKIIDWTPKRRVERQYQDALSKLMNRLLSARLPLGDAAALSSRLIELSTDGWFTKFAASAARSMVTGLAVGQHRTWREAARESMRGRELYQALQNELTGPVGFRVATLVSDNAWLIKSLPVSLAAETNAHIASEQRKGRRSEDIARDLREWFPQMAHSRVMMIARTETSKASTALTRARSEDLELPAYIWRTSKDARVRSSHRHMDGVICFWDDPPSPEALIGINSSLGHYACGDAPNDRCYPEPVLRLGQITFPAKVYRNGSITRLTRAAFTRIAGVEVAA